MSTYIDLAPGVGDVMEIALSVGDQQSASVAEVARAIAPCKGRVVGVAAWVERVGGGTLPTDVDVMVEKGTTDLCSAVIDCWGSSTDNGPQMGTLSTTASEVAVAAGDIFTLDTTVTGGGSVTIESVQARVWMVRE